MRYLTLYEQPLRFDKRVSFICNKTSKNTARITSHVFLNAKSNKEGVRRASL